MQEVFDILVVMVPAIITGIFSFIITKYTYNKNVPLDKLEISYNRVYYPLSRFLKEKSVDDYDSIIEKVNYYVRRYEKYIDRSTLNAYRSLEKCKTSTEKKDLLIIFKDNIYNKSYYLRRRLGYLEPGFLQVYKYSSPKDKFSFRIVFEFLGLYIAVILCGGTKGSIQEICIAFVILFLLVIFAEYVHRFVVHLYYKLKK